jgi:hypothetical protein
MTQTATETHGPSTGGIPQTDPTSRWAAVVAAILLIAIAVVHLVDGPVSMNDTFYVGALELALAAACAPLALVLIAQPGRAVWVATATLVTAALAIYLASRTTGLPGATDDIGNWGETLGIINVATELAVIGLAGWVLARRSYDSHSLAVRTTLAPAAHH